MTDESPADEVRNEPRTAPVLPLESGSITDVKLLTVAEVAQFMRVSKMSVYRLIHSGQLEAVRFGRSFRVPEKAAHAYLQESFYETG